MGYAGYVQLAFGKSSRTRGRTESRMAKPPAHRRIISVSISSTTNAVASVFVMTDGSGPVECGQNSPFGLTKTIGSSHRCKHSTEVSYPQVQTVQPA